MISTSSVSRPAAGFDARLLYAFLLAEFLCQTAPVVEALGQFRIAFRIGTFAISLAMLGMSLFSWGNRRYPIRVVAGIFLGILMLELCHPNLNSLQSGFASIALNLAIWAPAFWVGSIRITPEVFRRVILIVWAYLSLSSAVGVLQVYYPDRFMPDPEFVRQLYGNDRLQGLKVKLDDGTSVFRPMGLSDSPGGASAAGQEVIVLGMGIAIFERQLLLRILGMASAGLGTFCILITQVRSALVLAVIGIGVLLGILILRGRVQRATGVAICGAVVLVGGFTWAASIGSDIVNKRFSTLTEQSPDEVYYSNRGLFLDHTLNDLLFEHPLGAGLGRWGMMNTYFGDPVNADAPPMHVEIQPTAWVIDGGLPLLAIGFLAIVAAVWLSGRIALTHPNGRVADQATVVVAFGVAMLFGTLGRVPFIAQAGIMFWLLNAALYSAAIAPRLAARKSITAAS